MNNQEDEIKEQEKEKKSYRKASFVIVALVLVLFTGVLYITGVIGQHFGIMFENISLAVIGVILAIMLVKNKSK
ncbi:MAG: hypothetical protein RR313_06865 [Anaerovoracaceae bacterium]